VEFLYELPTMPMDREERILLIKKALQDEEKIRTADLDELLARLLGDIQCDPPT
jgi:hypothetical protein